MRWRDIFEANLKLLPDELPRMRGSYGAFIITMPPEDFLKLTASPNDYARIASRPFPQSRETFTADGGRENQIGRFPMPFLTVEWPSGQVVGHEGRHRALMVQRQGGRNYPVVIFLRAEKTYAITYRHYVGDSEEPPQAKETFPDSDAAYRRRRELEADMDVFGVDLQTSGGGALKGSPTMADPNNVWNRKAFVIADMPTTLSAEYNKAIKVSGFRVGLLKGYTHFR